MKKIFFLVALTLVVKLNATNHFATSSNEANKLLNSAKPTDTVTLKDGIYKNAIIKFTNNNIYFVAEHTSKVFFQENSTLSFAGNKIIIDGFVWQNGGKDLSTKSVIEFKHNNSQATYSTVTNCIIDGYNTVDLNTDNKWISMYGEYNTLTHCELKNKFNRGATLVVWLEHGKAAHHTISYNYFFNRQNGPDVDNGLESLRIGDSKTSFTPAHCVVAFNRFEACDGEIEIISNKSWNNSYLHNTFINNDGGLTLRHGNNCLVDGNYFDGVNKKKSYGVRFIGEGHVAINNYFYHLNGSPTQAFRAPITLVNGLVNTPLNGYYQVRRAVITDNVFINCIMPNIRVGAFSSRAGMTVAPDTVLIQNNLMYDEGSNIGQVYEELTLPSNLVTKNNLVIGKNLQTNTKGFKIVRDNKTEKKFIKIIAITKEKKLSISFKKAMLTNNITAGADWMQPAIANAISNKKFSYVTINEVGVNRK